MKFVRKHSSQFIYDSYMGVISLHGPTSTTSGRLKRAILFVYVLTDGLSSSSTLGSHSSPNLLSKHSFSSTTSSTSSLFILLYSRGHISTYISLLTDFLRYNFVFILPCTSSFPQFFSVPAILSVSNPSSSTTLPLFLSARTSTYTYLLLSLFALSTSPLNFLHTVHT